jgi:hypothetical protein
VLLFFTLFGKRKRKTQSTEFRQRLASGSDVFVESVGEKYDELSHYYAPVMHGHTPFFSNFLNGEVNGFPERVVGGVDSLGFRELAEHTVEALNGVSGVDEFPDFLRVLEKRREFRPVSLS